MLSIVVSWCDRDELKRAIPSMVALAKSFGGDVTVVNYGGDAERLAPQLASFEDTVRTVSVGRRTWFNKSRAQNIGAAATKGDMLFFCDCDIDLDAGQTGTLIRTVMERQDVFGTLKGVKETSPNARQANNLVRFGYTLHLRIANGRTLTIVDHEEDAEDGTRQAPGLLVVRRTDFLTIGGYNGAFEGWGWEDQDMIARLTLGAGLERIIHGTALHISHDDAARIARYPGSATRWESRDRIFRQALANYDADCFLGTYQEDAASAPD
jgi:hypothetical protein